MKKILCLIDSLGSGGAQRQLVGLASMLQEQENNVEVLWYHKNDFYKKELDKNNVPYKNIVRGNPIAKLYAVYKEIKRYKPDTLIAYIDGPTIISCLLKIFGLKYRLIVSERNTTQKLSLKERLKFFLYRWADFIVPNSYSQECFIKEHYLNLSKKIVTITNFTDTDYFVPLKDKKANEFMNLLVVARVVPSKNVLGFIKAIKTVVDKGYILSVNWFGKPFTQEYYDECISLIKTLNLENVFKIKKETSDIRTEYQKADVFCLPSFHEGYPNVVCEAMSCGLPILCSNVCDNATIVKDGFNGYLFDPNSIEDIVSKIISIISSKQIIEKGYNSRLMSVDMFSKKVFIEKYMEII